MLTGKKYGKLTNVVHEIVEKLFVILSMKLRTNYGNAF